MRNPFPRPSRRPDQAEGGPEAVEEQPRKFQSNREFLSFLYQRIRQKRKWWLLPVLLLLYVLASMFNLPGKESVLPALYFLF